MSKNVKNQLRTYEREKHLKNCDGKTQSLLDYRASVILQESEQLLDRVYLKFATEWFEKIPAILLELYGGGLEKLPSKVLNLDSLVQPEDEDSDAEFMELLCEFILFDYALLDGSTIFQRYLEREFKKLRPMVKDVVKEWAMSHVSIYEIESIRCEGDRGLFRDIFSGEVYEADLQLLNYFLAITEGDLLVCRLLPINGYYNISGYFLLFGGLKDQLVERVRQLKEYRMASAGKAVTWSEFLKRYGYEVAMLAYDLSNTTLHNSYDSFCNVEDKLVWPEQRQLEVARLIRSHFSPEVFSPEDVFIAITIWNEFCVKKNPRVTKVETQLAAMEYLTNQSSGYGITQREIADKYGVSPTSVSARSREIMETIALGEGILRIDFDDY